MASRKVISGETDGALAVAHELDTTQVISTSGAKLVSIKNAGVEVTYIDKDGNLSGIDHKLQEVTAEKHNADSAAADITTEHSIFNASRDITITAVKFIPDAALTASDTDFATLILSKRDASGGSKATVASFTTEITTGSGDWVAFVVEDFGTIASAALAAGGSLTWEITKTASGVIVPSGTIQIEYGID